MPSELMQGLGQLILETSLLPYRSLYLSVYKWKPGYLNLCPCLQYLHLHPPVCVCASIHTTKLSAGQATSLEVWRPKKIDAAP